MLKKSYNRKNKISDIILLFVEHIFELKYKKVCR